MMMSSLLLMILHLLFLVETQDSTLDVPPDFSCGLDVAVDLSAKADKS